MIYNDVISSTAYPTDEDLLGVSEEPDIGIELLKRYNRETDTLLYDRKLKDGPGESMYGLEVCKSLHLPSDFLNKAHKFRIKFYFKKRRQLSLFRLLVTAQAAVAFGILKGYASQ